MQLKFQSIDGTAPLKILKLISKLETISVISATKQMKSENGVALDPDLYVSLGILSGSNSEAPYLDENLNYI